MLWMLFLDCQEKNRLVRATVSHFMEICVSMISQQQMSFLPTTSKRKLPKMQVHKLSLPNFNDIVRSVVILLLGTCFGVIADTGPQKKRLFSVMLAGMNFLENSSILSMEKGLATSYTLCFTHYVRLGYAVWMLESIIEEVDTSNCLYVMYDIACSLYRHLRVSFL